MPKSPWDQADTERSLDFIVSAPHRWRLLIADQTTWCSLSLAFLRQRIVLIGRHRPSACCLWPAASRRP